MEQKKDGQIYVDKTNAFIQTICEFLKANIDHLTVLDYYRLIGEIGHLVKIGTLEQSKNVTLTARRLKIKRTTLAEYMRKIGYKKNF